MVNPVRLWAFLARMGVRGGDPWGPPTNSKPSHRVQSAQSKLGSGLVMEGWGSLRKPGRGAPPLSALAPALWAPDLYLSRLIGTGPWEPG